MKNLEGKKRRACMKCKSKCKMQNEKTETKAATLNILLFLRLHDGPVCFESMAV